MEEAVDLRGYRCPQILWHSSHQEMRVNVPCLWIWMVSVTALIYRTWRKWLCQFPGSGRKRLAASTSCPLGKPVTLPTLWPPCYEEAQASPVERPCEERDDWPVPSWSSLNSPGTSHVNKEALSWLLLTATRWGRPSKNHLAEPINPRIMRGSNELLF